MTKPVNTLEEQNVECLAKEESEKGASLVEYALLVALIAIVCIVAVRTLGNTISNQFTAMNSQIGG